MQISQTPWPNFRVKTHSDTLSYSICRSNEGMQLINCNAIVPFALVVVTGVRGPRRATPIRLQMTKVYAVHHHLTSTFEQTTINQSINQSINYKFPAWCWVCVQGDPVSCSSMILHPELIAPSCAAASDSLNPPSHSPSSTWAACPCWHCLGVGCASAFLEVWYPPVLPHGQATSAFRS